MDITPKELARTSDVDMTSYTCIFSFYLWKSFKSYKHKNTTYTPQNPQTLFFGGRGVNKGTSVLPRFLNMDKSCQKQMRLSRNHVGGSRAKNSSQSQQQEEPAGKA